MLIGMVIDGFDVPEDGATQDAVADLIVRVASGDQAAFATLYDLLSSRVFGLILRVLVNRSQSEEVLQEVFLEIWQSASRFAPNRGQGRAWIMTIAHRRAVDRVRASQSSADRDVRAGFKDIGVAHDSVAEQVELGIEEGRSSKRSRGFRKRSAKHSSSRITAVTVKTRSRPSWARHWGRSRHGCETG